MVKLFKRFTRTKGESFSGKVDESTKRSEGIFDVTEYKAGVIPSYYNEDFSRIVSVSYQTLARVVGLSKSPIPSANIEEGTLLCLITEKGEGLGRFPRQLSDEESNMLLGSKINYFERQYNFFHELEGHSQPWEHKGTYNIEVIEGPHKGFRLEEIVRK